LYASNDLISVYGGQRPRTTELGKDLHLLSSHFASLVFMGGFHGALMGMAQSRIVMGAQESLMRAAIPELLPRNRLGFAVDLFNAAYGAPWFAGSAILGIL
jgi:hypothetical protein